MPCLLDEDADEGGGEGERDHEGKKVDSAQNGVGAEDGLKVEREKIGAGNEYHAVNEANP